MPLISSPCGYLISDGEKLAVGYPSNNLCFFLESYAISSLSITDDFIDVNQYGHPWPSLISTGQSLEFTVHSSGIFRSMPLEEASKIFRTAESMSVSELFAIAYQKLEQRQS